jgi:hypothetical protein
MNPDLLKFVIFGLTIKTQSMVMKKLLNLMFKIVLCLFIFIIGLTESKAQKDNDLYFDYEFDTTAIYLIKLINESTFTGKFKEKRDNIVVFTSNSLKLEVAATDIVFVKKVDPSSFHKGKYWFQNPHYTRYLFGPSAFSLKKGEGYYQNIYGVVNSVNFGITDHFTLGGGTELISLFIGYPVLMLNPKLGNYQVGNKLHAGGGSFLALAEDGIFGIGYGIITQGTPDKNITFGLGWAFSSSGDLEAKPVVTISGASRLSKNISFVTENWLIPFDGYKPVISYGLRFFGERIAVDFAFINSIEIAQYKFFIGYPYIDFVYKF